MPRSSDVSRLTAGRPSVDGRRARRDVRDRTEVARYELAAAPAGGGGGRDGV
jgi:hypothetical protein